MIKKIVFILIVSLLTAGVMRAYFYYVELQSCPSGYISLPDEEPEICLAKYEMKKGPKGNAISQANGLPWVDLTRQEALLACKEIGYRYDLIDITTWTSVARNIAFISENWSTNFSFKGSLNLGNAFDVPGKNLEASSDDYDNCFAMGVDCPAGEWNIHNRTHVLSNGEVIWDFSGNVAEFTKNRLQSPIAFETNFFKLMEFHRSPISMFGPLDNCDKNFVFGKRYVDKEKRNCGFGRFIANRRYVNAAVTRGGYWGPKNGEDAGIYTAMLTMKDNEKSPKVGFRCTFKPFEKITSLQSLISLLQSNRDSL